RCSSFHRVTREICAQRNHAEGRMNGAELVRLVTNVLFLLVFVGALRTALRERSRTSVDATILFGALAVVIAQSQIAALLRAPLPAAFGLVSPALLPALPYLHLR